MSIGRNAKEALQNGDPLNGFLVMLPSSGSVEALAGAGADFAFIDLEHAPIGIETAAGLISAGLAMGVAPIVRVPGTNSDLVKPVLDSGAQGIAFPQISSADDARAAVRVTRYQPQGERGYGPAYAALRWGLSPRDYVARANDAILLILLIESPKGVAALDDILDVDGIDIVIIARSDLSESLGVPGDFDHPDVLAAVEEAEAKIMRRSGVAIGTNARTPEEAKDLIRRGYQFVVMGTDIGLLKAGASSVLSKVRDS